MRTPRLTALLPFPTTDRGDPDRRPWRLSAPRSASCRLEESPAWGRRPAALQHAHRACGGHPSWVQAAAPPQPLPRREQRAPGHPGQRGAARWSVQLHRVRQRPVQPIWGPMCGCLSHRRRRRRRRRCRLLHRAYRRSVLPDAHVPFRCPDCSKYRRGAHAAAGTAAGHHSGSGATARRQRQRSQGWVGRWWRGSAFSTRAGQWMTPCQSILSAVGGQSTCRRCAASC